MWHNEPTSLEKNASRNRGSAHEWFQHTADYNDPSPKTRTRPEAQRIVNKQATSQIPFDPRAPVDAKLPPDEAPALRIRGNDAAVNAAKHLDPREKWFDFEGNLNYTPDSRKPRCNGNAAQQIVKKMTSPVNQDWYKHKQFDPNEQRGDQQVYLPGSTVNGKQIKDKMTRPSDWYAHETAPQSTNDYDGSVRSADTDWRPPRTLGDGSDYAVRNIRGTSTDWLLTHDPQYAEEKPPQRLASRQAVAISDKHAGSGMRSCLTVDGQPHEDPDIPPQRILKSAEANYIRNRGLATQMMAGEVELEPDLGSRNLVGDLANTIADRHRGQVGSVLDHQSNQSYAVQDELPKPRAPTAVAQKQLERGRGTFDFADASYRAPAEDRKVHPRTVYGNAVSIADKSRGSATQELLSNHELPSEEQPAQRLIGTYAQQNATRNAGTGWSLLAHDSGAMLDSVHNRMPAAAKRVVDRQAANSISKTLQMMPPSDR